MSLTNPNTPVSQQDLQDFYHKLLPYMGVHGANVEVRPTLTSGEKIAEVEIEGLTTNLYAPESNITPVLGQVLAAGNTSVTFKGIPTVGDYVVNFYTSTGINYTAIDTSIAGQVTLVFNEQSENVIVYCEITKVAISDVPSGKYVIPTDDIPTWLECAGLNGIAYTTINEVLNDTATLSALINNANAVDYLERSSTWALDICSDSTAMADIGANNYCANTLLDNETWLSAICNSAYFESVLNVKIPVMTSNTTPSGEASASGVWKAGYEAYKAFNGNTSQTQGWINDKNNEQNYRYVRVICEPTSGNDVFNGLAVFQVYGRRSV